MGSEIFFSIGKTADKSLKLYKSQSWSFDGAPRVFKKNSMVVVKSYVTTKSSKDILNISFISHFGRPNK